VLGGGIRCAQHPIEGVLRSDAPVITGRLRRSSSSAGALVGFSATPPSSNRGLRVYGRGLSLTMPPKPPGAEEQGASVITGRQTHAGGSPVVGPGGVNPSRVIQI
jgi:hypothetical protein